MTDAEFADSMHSIALSCRLLLNLDDHLDRCLNRVSQGQQLGPVVDPSGFAAGGGHNLAATRRLLEAAIGLRDIAKQIAPEHLDLSQAQP